MVQDIANSIIEDEHVLSKVKGQIIKYFFDLRSPS